MNTERLQQAENALSALVRRNVARILGGRPSSYRSRLEAIRGQGDAERLREVIRVETDKLAQGGAP